MIRRRPIASSELHYVWFTGNDGLWGMSSQLYYISSLQGSLKFDPKHNAGAFNPGECCSQSNHSSWISAHLVGESIRICTVAILACSCEAFCHSIQRWTFFMQHLYVAVPVVVTARSLESLSSWRKSTLSVVLVMGYRCLRIIGFVALQ